MGKMVGARAYNNANVVCTGGAATTTVPLNSEIYDYDTIHDPSTNNERLTCKTAGIYIAAFAGVWASALPAGSGVWIEHDTRGRVAQQDMENLDATTLTVPPIDLAVNDYLVVKVFVASGGDINLVYSGTNEYSPFFGMHRIG